MLFEDFGSEPKKEVRPVLPKGFVIDYQIGFLFNFVSGKSTRFDLEPVLIVKEKTGIEYKRISLQAEKGLALLQPLPDQFYNEYIGFSDNKLLQWMTATGNRFIRNISTGTWAHKSARELVALRKHYVDLLQKVWPYLVKWPHLFILKQGRFNSQLPQTVKLGAEPARFSFTLDAKGDAIIAKMKLLLDGKEVPVKVVGGILLEHDNTLYLPPNAAALAIIDQFKYGNVTFPLSLKKEVVQKYILPWQAAGYPVEISDRLKISMINPEVQSRIRLSELNESNLMIRPQFMYDGEEVDYGQELHHVVEAKNSITVIYRNKEEEKELYEYLRTLHPAFANQRNNMYYYLPFDDVMKKGWFVNMMRKVQEHGYSIHGFAELKKFRYSTEIPKFNIEASSQPDWFDLKIKIEWGKYEVTLKEIRHAILHGQDTIMFDDGTLGHIPDEWISQYALLLRTGTEDNGTLRVSKMHFGLLEDLLENFDATSRLEIEDRKRKLVDYDKLVTIPLSNEIKATLRPYQQSGFNWLQALDELGWGGCLADDMGLGKTLQTISFLQYLKERHPGSTQLVICPTSLIFNWESEIQKFCPTLKYFTYYGGQREFSNTHFEEYDVVLTTYGVVRNDEDLLSEFLWQYIILDESQAIKNPDARVTKSLKKLRSVNRMIISGTPVQNNTGDLFAQFNFLNPGLLGSREFFNREFATPIDKLGSKEKTAQLRKLIYPFTLRRTKEQVAQDLPDKTISVLWCTMDAEQRAFYNEYRDRYKTRLLKKIDEEGIAKSGLDVLEALLRLRQICDHPALVKKDDAALSSSVKIEELIREVQENAGEHKVLIFSQFTEMLHLIRDQFEDAGIKYSYLDGSLAMEKRRDEVSKFNEDESVRAFLISLKAGGVGLNLTVADYVYIVDPWWNPAAEMQAIDRAHRIGQKRKVFAYKMICKDSVEEKILQLQERKKMLADDLIQEDTNLVKSLSRDDVEFLFG